MAEAESFEFLGPPQSSCLKRLVSHQLAPDRMLIDLFQVAGDTQFDD